MNKKLLFAGLNVHAKTSLLPCRNAGAAKRGPRPVCHLFLGRQQKLFCAGNKSAKLINAKRDPIKLLGKHEKSGSRPTIGDVVSNGISVEIWNP